MGLAYTESRVHTPLTWALTTDGSSREFLVMISFKRDVVADETQV